MTKDKNKKEQESLNITEEENMEEQYEFGLNEDKREEAQKDGVDTPEDQAVEISKDAKEVDYDKKNDDK